jgi:hypothetical protein
MKQFLLISLLLFYNYVFSQHNLVISIGKRILTADSIIILYTPKVDSVNLSTLQSTDSVLYKNLFINRKKLSSSSKYELSQIFVNPTNYSGRFASRSGFDPTEFIVIWKNKICSYIKVSKRTHDLWSSNPNIGFIDIDPFFVDRLELFYQRVGIKNKN